MVRYPSSVVDVGSAHRGPRGPRSPATRHPPAQTSRWRRPAGSDPGRRICLAGRTTSSWPSCRPNWWIGPALAVPMWRRRDAAV